VAKSSNRRTSTGAEPSPPSRAEEPASRRSAKAGRESGPKKQRGQAGSTPSKPVLSAGTCEYVYLAVIDPGFLVGGVERQPIPKILARSQDSLRGIVTGIAANERLGNFEQAEPEHGPLGQEISKAQRAGGKQIFTQEFLGHLTPYVSRRERVPAPLVASEDGTGLPIIGVGQSFALPSHATWKYQSATLRVFLDGGFGLELRFRSEAEQQDCSSLISELKNLEETYAGPAAFNKLKRVVESIREKAGLAPFELNFPKELEFARSVSIHRIAVLQSLGETPPDFDKLAADPAVLQAVNGILNRADWFENYCSQYSNALAPKFIAYQRDEFFITDRNATLILFPQYFSDKKDKQQFVENTVIGCHYLLSWEAFGRHLSSALDQFHKPGRHDSPDDLLDGLEALLDAYLRVRDALAVRTIVDHGFTARVLDQFLKERDLPARVDAISKKIETAIKMREVVASHARQEVNAQKARGLQRVALHVALVSLLISALTSVISCYINVTNYREKKRESAPHQSATPPKEEKVEEPSKPTP